MIDLDADVITKYLTTRKSTYTELIFAKKINVLRQRLVQKLRARKMIKNVKELPKSGL